MFTMKGNRVKMITHHFIKILISLFVSHIQLLRENGWHISYPMINLMCGMCEMEMTLCSLKEIYWYFGGKLPAPFSTPKMKEVGAAITSATL